MTDCHDKLAYPVDQSTGHKADSWRISIKPNPGASEKNLQKYNTKSRNIRDISASPHACIQLHFFVIVAVEGSSHSSWDNCSALHFHQVYIFLQCCPAIVMTFELKSLFGYYHSECGKRDCVVIVWLLGCLVAWIVHTPNHAGQLTLLPPHTHHALIFANTAASNRLRRPSPSSP